MNEITLAIKAAKTYTNLADVCGVTPQAVRKWEKSGKLPRTEWTEETNYAEKIYRNFGVIVSPFCPPEENQTAA